MLPASSLSEGFMARVFKSRHRYSTFAPPFTGSDRVMDRVVRFV
jgi:hypothetical protein